MSRALTLISVATAGFLTYGVLVESPFVYYYVPITVALTGLIALIHRSARFADSTLLALALAGIGNMAGGVILVAGEPLYGLAMVGGVRYDKIFHALATGVAGWAAYEAVRRWGIRKTGLAAFTAILMASGAGALVEMIEYAGSLIFDNTSVGDYGNNMLDLVANTAGASIAVVAATRRDLASG